MDIIFTKDIISSFTGHPSSAILGE